MPNTRKKLLSITNLKKYFPIAKSSIFQKEQLYVRANEDISFDIYEGETIGIVGESGCGKSTLGRVILQLYEQTAGSTMYYGRSRSDLAPKYVAHTLKYAAKYVTKYKQAKEKAEKLTADCEAAGDDATFFQLQDKNLAVAEAKTALHNVVTILGGFIVLEDISEGATVLLNRHNVHVAMAKIRHKLEELHAKEDLAESKLSEAEKDSKKAIALAKRVEKIKAAIKTNEETLVKLGEERVKFRQQLIDLKEKYKDNEEFQRYDAMIDKGIDLARLNYNEMRQLRRDLQIIFQDPYSSLNPRMTVGQIIEEGLVTHNFFKHGSPKMKEYILKIMNECGLQDYMIHRYPHQFSGGQRQRICIARALAVQPKFVVCDECVSALDVSIQSQIINLLLELKERDNLTYLFISHDLSVVRYISDRICVMYLGNVVEFADAKVLFEDPRHPYTLALLSSIPTTDMESLKKERILLEGNIPSPIKPPTGCKFHTRCYMATEQCKRVPPPLVEVAPGHLVACHNLDKKVDGKGHYLFKLKKTAKLAKSTEATADAKVEKDAEKGE